MPDHDEIKHPVCNTDEVYQANKGGACENVDELGPRWRPSYDFHK